MSRREALSSFGTLLSLPALSMVRGASSKREPATVAEFLDAVRHGSGDRVRNMLAANGSLASSVDEQGRSAFVLAHLRGHDGIAALLRETGIQLDIVEAVLAEDWDRFGELATRDEAALARNHPIGGTPLYAAALVGSHGNWRLRARGCKSDAAPAGGSGYTPARGAMESEHASWARIALTDLCSNGGDVNAPQRAGSSVLHAAVRRRDEVLVRLAVRKGADVEAIDASGKTPHALAKELGWELGAKLLAEHESLPRDNRASRFALDANREPVVRPDLSDVAQDVQSAVTGNSHANLPKVRELVQTDERLIFSVSSDDELAIEACAHVGNREIIRYHLDHGAPLSLPTAVALGDAGAVDFWLDRDPSLANERGAHDFPVMWYAAGPADSVAMAERLVGLGCSIEQESVGSTVLHQCVQRRDLPMAKWLLERGANPEPVGFRWSRTGRTPLQLAQERADTPMANLLKQSGARR